MGSLDPQGWIPAGIWLISLSKIVGFSVNTTGTDSFETFFFFLSTGVLDFSFLEKGFVFCLGPDEVPSKLLIIALQL